MVEISLMYLEQKVFDVFCRNRLFKVKLVIVGVEDDVLLGDKARIKINLVRNVLEGSSINHNNHATDKVLELMKTNNLYKEQG